MVVINSVTFLYMYVGSLGIYIGAELLVLHIWGTVVNTVSRFPKWLYQFALPPSRV